LPKSWDWKGLAKINIIETLSEEEEKEAHSIQNQNKDLNWMNRLATLRNLQASEESIKNFEDLKTSIFNSSSTSILVYLQTPISAQRIKKQIETVHIDAMKRI